MRLLVDQRLAEAFDAWLEAFNQWIDAGSMINESFTIRAEKINDSDKLENIFTISNNSHSELS